MSLTEAQRSNLISIARDWVKVLAVPTAVTQLSEEQFTSTHLLPWLRQNVDTLNHAGLYVRGDGGPSVHPVYWNGINFFPDLEIATNTEKHIAFEVKFLRNGSDSGGALAKAQGQTLIYSTYGYAYGFGMVFDLRRVVDEPGALIEWSSYFSAQDNSELHIFS